MLTYFITGVHSRFFNLGTGLTGFAPLNTLNPGLLGNSFGLGAGLGGFGAGLGGFGAGLVSPFFGGPSANAYNYVTPTGYSSGYSTGSNSGYALNNGFGTVW